MALEFLADPATVRLDAPPVAVRVAAVYVVAAAVAGQVAPIEVAGVRLNSARLFLVGFALLTAAVLLLF